jgi:Family of unknown function (DUF5317)
MRHFFRSTMLWILAAPIAIGFIGAASNQAVLIANHDRFPVLLNAVGLQHAIESGIVVTGDDIIMIDETHCVMTSKTRLNFLADIFDFHSEWVSVGDMLLDLSDWLWHFCPAIWFALVIRKLLCSPTPKPLARCATQPETYMEQDIPDMATGKTNLPPKAYRK